MARDDAIAVEVVYALLEEQVVIALTVRCGTTVAAAIELSGLGARFPEIRTKELRVGIHGRVVPRDTLLGDGDRVEIYRPLIADPKQTRRRRAARSA